MRVVARFQLAEAKFISCRVMVSGGSCSRCCGRTRAVTPPFDAACLAGQARMFTSNERAQNSSGRKPQSVSCRVKSI